MSIWEIGLMTKSMESVSMCSRIRGNTMEASKTTKFADRETLSGLMVHFSQVIG
jgi:hypothetical protein